MSEIETISGNCSDLEQLEQRVMELEIRSAHQEDTIEQLNQVIFNQQQQIDDLNRHLSHLKSQLNNLQEATAKESEETPPPHY